MWVQWPRMPDIAPAINTVVHSGSLFDSMLLLQSP
jgi:hypothetical protein